MTRAEGRRSPMNSQSLFGPTGISVSELCDTTELAVEPTGRDAACARVTVTNSGAVAGKHVVQVYMSTVAGPVRRPLRELRGFTKVSLVPGKTRTVTVHLDRRAFAYRDIELGRWVVPSGEYRVRVCADASTVLTERAINLAGDSVIRELSMESTVGRWSSSSI